MIVKINYQLLNLIIKLAEKLLNYVNFFHKSIMIILFIESVSNCAFKFNFLGGAKNEEAHYNHFNRLGNDFCR